MVSTGGGAASLLRAVRFLRSRRPKVLLLEWWTAATLHTYLLLAIVARAAGMRVVIELHELQDPGEAGSLSPAVTAAGDYAR